MAFTLILLALASCDTGKEKAKNSDDNVGTGTKIQSGKTGIYKLLKSEVCMINNKFMHVNQIPVPVNNKTYYGCFEGCVLQLKNYTATRYASDPLTAEVVDKAVAVIIVKPGVKDEVLFSNRKIM